MNARILLVSCNLILLLFVHASYAQDTDRYRTIDGSQNNPNHPDWGAAETQLLRATPVGYADGISAIGGIDRPNPRIISNALFDQPDLLNDPLLLSDFCWAFGQFIDHDFGFTLDGSELAFIEVPKGDPDFDPAAQGQAVIPLIRSAFDPNTGRDTDNPRQHINVITAYIDGSGVYGSDEERAHWLRTFRDGKLKVSSGNLMPFNTIDGEFDSDLSHDAPEMDNATRLTNYLFVAGDARANENPLLIALHTLFVREHNRQCDRLMKEHPDWDDEELYQHARKIVGGLIQSIVYDEWLPAIGIDLPAYSGYAPSINPQLTNTFTAAAFRLGHTLLSGAILRMDEEGNTIEAGDIGLRDAFFNVHAIIDVDGIDPYLNGMAEQTQQQFDAHLVDDVRNFLFGPPGVGGLDLASINIQRGRERGLPGYNEVRKAFGLEPYQNFRQINPDRTVSDRLLTLYKRVDNVDPWVGMLSEKAVENSLFGPTLQAILIDQFIRLRDGDRFYYLNDPVLSDTEKNWITRATFRDVIMYNTGIRLMQDNVFRSMPRSEVCANMNLFISGQIRTGSGKPVPKVDLTFVMEDNTMRAETAVDGSYDFGLQAACGMQKITPSKQDALANGLSTFDLVLIARHILGVDSLASPYQQIAADFNEDRAITILDLIAAQSVILGRPNELDTLRPWRFVLGGFDFDPVNPLADDFPELLDFDAADPADFTSGFVAVKRGDVNETFQPEPKSGPVSLEPDSPALLVSFPNRYLEAGEATTLTLAAEALEPLAGFQFSLSGSGLEFGRISSFALPYSAVDSDGQLRVSYAQPEGWSGNAPLIEVEVRAKRAGLLTELLSMNKALASEAYDQQLNLRSVALRAETRTTAPFVGGDAFPDPAQTIVNIPFYQESAGNVRLSVYDPTGRLLREWKEYRPAGSQYWVIERAQLANPSGNLVFRIEGNQGSYTGKMTWF